MEVAKQVLKANFPAGRDVLRPVRFKKCDGSRYALSYVLKTEFRMAVISATLADCRVACDLNQFQPLLFVVRCLQSWRSAMDDQTTRARSGFWHFILLVLLAAAFAFMATRSAEQSSKEPESEVLGFDVWCLEMQMYPAIRCDAHRNEDAQDYEKYRASVEQFEADKKARALRDQELQRRLNHDPTAPPSTGVQAR